MGQIVAAYAYEDGQRVREIELGESRGFARSRNEFVWIGFLWNPPRPSSGCCKSSSIFTSSRWKTPAYHHAPKL